jgi:hypothetical protein
MYGLLINSPPTSYAVHSKLRNTPCHGESRDFSSFADKEKR